MFPNEDGALFPNQFVNARLLLEVKQGVTIVPSAAVQRGVKGPFVYVVSSDRTVAVRNVGVGAAQGEDLSITAGLSSDELVVVDGTERLREGSQVEIRNRDDRQPAAPPSESGAPQRGTRL